MPDRTLADLYKSKDVTEDDIDAAVRAYLADAGGSATSVGSASLDIGDAVQANPYAREIMSNPDAPEGQRRNAVRTAMLLAVVKAKA